MIIFIIYLMVLVRIETFAGGYNMTQFICRPISGGQIN